MTSADRSKSFDYVIVGAGSAGCVLAARLTEDPAVRVLLLEAGGPDKGAVIDMPLRWFEAMRAAPLGWGFMSEEEPFADRRRIPAPRGKLLGGCSSINGMMYSRGNRADYDEWARMGLSVGVSRTYCRTSASPKTTGVANANFTVPPDP